MASELVSIITPSFNTVDYIKQTIKSVLQQTYQNWEMIIVDDGSTDETEEVVKSFLSDERIVYLKNDKNHGAAYSRNRALKLAKGKWIAFLDSDDLWESDKLEKQVAFMEKNDYHFSYTNYREITEEGNPNGVIVTGPKKITRTGMANYCWPGCLTVMYDREYVGLIQIYEIEKNNDYAMWLKVSEKTDCYLLDECLASYRRGRFGGVSTASFETMIGWHYKLFRKAEGQCVIVAVFNTCRNMIFGSIKKMVYVVKNKRK